MPLPLPEDAHASHRVCVRVFRKAFDTTDRNEIEIREKTMKTTKTLLAVAILGVSAAAVAAETVLAPVAPVFPVVAPAFYAPYAVAPVAVDPAQIRAAIEEQGRQALAAFEQSSKARAAANAEQRKVAEEFQSFHNEQIKTVTSTDNGSYESIRKAGDEMRADMDKLAQEIQSRLASGDRAAVAELFAARAQDLDARFASVDQEIEAARKAFDARASQVQRAPLTPMVLPGQAL